jgi:uncharacterized protein
LGANPIRAGEKRLASFHESRGGAPNVTWRGASAAAAEETWSGGGMDSINPFILKIASRCNLNCSYCYIYNQADTQWKSRPAVMSDEVFEATLNRIRRHCLMSGQQSIMLLFHGGEPTLVGARRFESMCRRAHGTLDDLANVAISIQTNALLIDEAWSRVLRDHQVQVGVSIDGPKEIHDRFRVDHFQQGSHDRTVRGLDRLREATIPFAILSVVQVGADPLLIHHHLLGLGCKSISYLLPAYTHETIGPIRECFGPTPCADFLMPIFDDWWFNSTIDIRIREFWNIGRLILGGDSEVDSVGNPPLRFVAIETDGDIEGLDKLRSCEDAMTSTGLNVLSADFHEVEKVSAFHAAVMKGIPLSAACAVCPEGSTCAGGYLPNRYSRARQFDNPSVWCADLLRLFHHIRGRLNVSVEETIARRRALACSEASFHQLARPN